MVLAHGAGQMTLPEEGIVGARSQLEALQQVRGNRNVDAARPLFSSTTEGTPQPAEKAPEFDPSLKSMSSFAEFGNLDREMAKVGLLSAGGEDAMDDVD
jgi:hypothetical protein